MSLDRLEGALNQLRTDRTRLINALKEARERLEAILQVCEFIDDEDKHQTKATEATLAIVNKALNGN